MATARSPGSAALVISTAAGVIVTRVRYRSGCRRGRWLAAFSNQKGDAAGGGGAGAAWHGAGNA
ncbi:hypothetical protein KCP71_17275 [Salmonella enterica subsp. enterica]|nr:hypothetical protein KCP71_17275 [Salmonella enterica subsp. enterica]